MSGQVETSQDRSNFCRKFQVKLEQVKSSCNRSSQVATGQVKSQERSFNVGLVKSNM